MSILDHVELAVEAAADKKAGDVVVLDVGDILAITDYFLICSANSDRQVDTIAQEVEVRLKQEGVKPIRVEGTPAAGWVLIDFGTFVVHVFTTEARAYYDLERLWKDAPRPELPALVDAREA